MRNSNRISNSNSYKTVFIYNLFFLSRVSLVVFVFGEAPAVPFEDLKRYVDEFGGDGFFEKVADWSESTWNVPNPNGTEGQWYASKVGVKRREGVENST